MDERTVVLRHGPGLRRDLMKDGRADSANPYMALHTAMGPELVSAEQAVPLRGRWAEVFGRDAPLHVEIGSGNGIFLSGIAAHYPDRNWLGVEIRYKRVVLCARKIQAMGLQNARIVRYDAWMLDDLFLDGSLAGLYVNHPDPWTKHRHAAKRLLGPQFMTWAARALAPGATLRLKTDHLPHVAHMIASAEGLPFELVGQREDIRKNGVPWGEDEVVTNYQRKFYLRGLPVHAAELRRRKI